MATANYKHIKEKKKEFFDRETRLGRWVAERKERRDKLKELQVSLRCFFVLQANPRRNKIKRTSVMAPKKGLRCRPPAAYWLRKRPSVCCCCGERFFFFSLMHTGLMLAFCFLYTYCVLLFVCWNENDFYFLVTASFLPLFFHEFFE